MMKKGNHNAALTERISVSAVFLIFSLACFCLQPSRAYCSKPTDLRSLIAELKSSDPQKAGKASVSLLKMADKINKSIIRLACSTAARVKAKKARPWMVKILLNRFEGKHGKKLADFDPSTRAICGLAVGKTTVVKIFEIVHRDRHHNEHYDINHDEEDDEEKDKYEDKEIRDKGDEHSVTIVKVDIGSYVVKALVTTLKKSESVPIRAASACSLGYTYSKKAVCPLYNIVKDPSENPLVIYYAA